MQTAEGPVCSTTYDTGTEKGVLVLARDRNGAYYVDVYRYTKVSMSVRHIGHLVFSLPMDEDQKSSEENIAWRWGQEKLVEIEKGE